MPYSTIRQYSVFECTLAGIPFADNIGPGVMERVKEGDIVGMRPEKQVPGIGMKEGRPYLWLRLTGLDDEQMWQLVQPLYDPPLPDDIDTPHDNSVLYDKRRFTIDLDALQALVPTLDRLRVRDPDDWYQPLLPSDPDTGLFIPDAAEPPFDVSGLLLDKQTTQRR